MIPLPGYTEKESIRVLLEALTDPNNDHISNAIRKALAKAGVTNEQISYYQTFGEMRPEIEDDINSRYEEANRAYEDMMSSPPRKRKKNIQFLVGLLAIVSLMLVALAFGILMVTDEVATEPPSITEQAPVGDGDKL